MSEIKTCEEYVIAKVRDQEEYIDKLEHEIELLNKRLAEKDEEISKLEQVKDGKKNELNGIAERTW